MAKQVAATAAVLGEGSVEPKAIQDSSTHGTKALQPANMKIHREVTL